MKVLVINSGSSSLKYKLYDSLKEMLSGHVDGIGLDSCEMSFKTGSQSRKIRIKVHDHVDAVLLAFKSLISSKAIKDYSEINAIGHRVVHGEELYNGAVLIDDNVIRNIKKFSEIAPLHNPDNLAGILACRKIFPRAKQFAVFDTAFHTSMPEVNFLYGLPYQLYKKHKIRKYGFHGTSHKWVAEEAVRLAGKSSRIISCHLGNGSSICAIKDGKSFNTSMGFTPLEGLVMGTRPGDFDPAIIFYLIHHLGYKLRDVEDLLNHKSGLLGISGKSGDVRTLKKLSLKGDKMAKLALDIFTARIIFYIGGYASQMGGVDCIAFTGGIGENAWYLRKRIIASLEFLGAKLDQKANRQSKLVISSTNSRIKVLVVACDEELVMARTIAGL